MTRAITNKRAVTIYFLFVFLFSAIAFQIIRLQVFRSSFFKQLAQNQHYKYLKLEGQRGLILDRRGRVLARGLHCYSVFADPSLIDDPKEMASILSKHTGVEREVLLARLQKDKHFVWIKRKVSLTKQQEIAALDLPGVGFLRERKRFYPQESLAASVVGITDIDNRGLEGVESFYNKYLQGKDGRVKVLRDSASREIILSSQIITPQAGADISLTIDAQIQYWVEEALGKAVKQFKARSATALVMDAASGEILALANYPLFNPNKLKQESLQHVKNKAITDMFEPGSVFKVVALLAAVNEKTFSKDETIFCEQGRFKIPGTVLHDWKPYGELSFEEVFMKSSNIGVAKVVSRIDPAVYAGYIRQLEFGRPTGIDLAGETRGRFKNYNQWSKTSAFIIPIGQEIGVNLLQLARSFGLIANGGYLVQPHVVKSICSYGFCKDINHKRRRLFSSSVCEEVKRILIRVVAEGTGKRAAVAQRLIGGKTGTAQKYDFELGRYSSTKYRATFAGFIADLDPPLVIAISVDEPRKSHFGGVVAAPVFSEIAKKVIAYLESQ